MAEQEVIKHTKKVFKIWNSEEHNFWQKLKEFLIEIFIIVFAISLSIWLHDKSEHNHQQKEVKEFLLGLREDLLNDINEIKDDEESYANQGKTFRYIAGIRLNQTLNEDSIRKYRVWLFNTTRLQENSGRFEGFKSSGKIGAIEDQTIQNDIMDLYQENIPSLLASTDAYLRSKADLNQFIQKNRKRITDSTTNLSGILIEDEAQNICSTLTYVHEIMERYDLCVDKMKKIVSGIENKYSIDQKPKGN